MDEGLAPVHAVVDGGAAVTRVAWRSGAGWRTHAETIRVRSGVHFTPSAIAYETDGEWLTADPHGGATPLETTAGPGAAVQGVRMRYALDRAGMPPDRIDRLGVVLAEGGSGVIDAPGNGLEKRIRRSGERSALALDNAGSVAVYPGARTALVDQRIDRAGLPVPPAADRLQIVDVGYARTRRVTLDAHTGQVIKPASGAHDIGVMHAAYALKRDLEAWFEGRVNPQLALADEWLAGSGWITLFGKRIDAREPLATALDGLADRVVSRCTGVEPVFIGGGAALLGARLTDRAGGTLAPAAGFSSALGALKHMAFSPDFSELFQ